VFPPARPRSLFRYTCIVILVCLAHALSAQTFEIADGDTINYTSAAGVKKGFWRYFWANGDLKYEVYYENGEKDGLEIRYYDNQDCIEFSNTYKHGTLDGPSVTFFPNCSTKCEEIYKDGKKDGYERCYDQTGLIQTEAQFNRGELVGTYSHFDKKGLVTYESPSKETTLKFDKFVSGEYKIKDSTIFKVFARNSQWKKVLLVVDMTGSMFPYIGQLLVWYKMNFESEKIKYYALFNDGDNIDDSKKIIGNTGGVHSFEAKDFKKFKKDLEDVRKKGEGGDDPENDIEAILKAMIACRDYGDIVLLADDSDMRDIKLLKRIKKPVHVILCGTKRGINHQYLQLAYYTKGSIHTLHNDVNMKTIKEGQHIELDNDLFVFQNGDFVWLDAKGSD
jgi:antitoxin component YwqK of YwqJK toxin-antitoxin module